MIVGKHSKAKVRSNGSVTKSPSLIEWKRHRLPTARRLFCRQGTRVSRAKNTRTIRLDCALVLFFVFHPSIHPPIGSMHLWFRGNGLLQSNWRSAVGLASMLNSPSGRRWSSHDRCSSYFAGCSASCPFYLQLDAQACIACVCKVV